MRKSYYESLEELTTEELVEVDPGEAVSRMLRELMPFEEIEETEE